MLGLIAGIALNACVTCTQPVMPGIDAPPAQPQVELAKHRAKHFVRSKRAWRYCRAIYGKRLTAAYESRTKWRCIHKVKRRR